MKLLPLIFTAILGLAHVCADEVDTTEDTDQWTGSNQLKVLTNGGGGGGHLFRS